ncbi:MAG: OsmC family protein [Bacteroidales bacterium]|nr:OsmC family protein [Bacteroidales bacterium]
MKETIEMKWCGDMAFEADVDGHRVIMDAQPKHGGNNKGPSPKPLMMVALAGCTAMDAISILNKMRVELDDFSVVVEGELTEEHPKHYTSMHIVFLFKGKDLPVDKLQRAVELSQEKYCGVSAVYRQTMDLTYEIKII